MNKELILRVADAMERAATAPVELMDARVSVDMGSFFSHHTDCGTTACVAGFTLLVFGERPELGLEGRTARRAAELLGLTHDYATWDALFYGFYWESRRDAMQPVRVLRHLAATGEVCWDLEPEAA